MTRFRRVPWTPDNRAGAPAVLFIGDPIAQAQDAAVQGAAVAVMARAMLPGYNGTARLGGSLDPFSLDRFSGYLKGSLILLASRPIGASTPYSYGAQGSYGGGRLPSAQTPLSALSASLTGLRGAYSTTGGA
jgi:hypothetical protein